MSKDIEFEGKVLGIDVEKTKTLLQKLSAKYVGSYDQKRYVFNTIPSTPSRWVRLRTNGQEKTLAVKQIDSDKIDGTSEWEVTVSDIDKTLIILQKIGIEPKGYQENKRDEYSLDGVMICIDQWPLIPPYLEIEGKDKSEVLKICKKLGFSEKELTGINTTKVYKKYGFDIESFKELKF